MKLVIDIPNAPINDYRDLYYKIHGMAASEGLFDDKVKSQRALALKVVLNVLEGVVEGTPLPKGHGRLIDADEIQFENRDFDTYGDYSRAFDAIDYAETIVEADKAESEGKE